MELARDPDFVSPTKRKRRCDEDVAGSSKRLLKMSESEVANISKLFVPTNTKKNIDWALTVFREWQSSRIAMASEKKQQCPSDKAKVEELYNWL